MSRRYERSEIDIDRYESDRRSSYTPSRARYAEPDIDFRRGSGPVPTRERDRETVIFKERDDYDRTPAFLKDDYGKTSAGAMVLRARDREEVTYAPRRRRSPSPEKTEREEIIIRRDERSESRPAPPRVRERSREREEIIIRRDEREQSRPPPPRPRERSREREEIIIRRDERSDSRPAAPRYRERERSREREEIIIKRREDDDRYHAAPRRARTEDFEREEIIIRREERDRDEDVVSRRSYRPPPPPPPPAREVDRQEIIIRRERDVAEEERVSRPISHERARSRVRSRSSDSEEEIIFRRDEREGRRGEETRQEIIIRRSSHSRSPSPVESVRTAPPPAPAPAPAPPPPEPQVIYAPQIHQEVITHHRHIDHGYEIQLPPRREPVYSRPPSLPSPPPPPPPEPVRERSEERIEIRRTDTRNGRRTEEDIIIDRTERERSEPPPPARTRERSVDIREEIDYRKDWAVRPYREPEPEPPTIGPRYGRPRDPRDGLWTEVTKDLVVREAIEEMGYEYEETDDFYYIFKYMAYVS